MFAAPLRVCLGMLTPWNPPAPPLIAARRVSSHVGSRRSTLGLPMAGHGSMAAEAPRGSMLPRGSAMRGSNAGGGIPGRASLLLNAKMQVSGRRASKLVL